MPVELEFIDPNNNEKIKDGILYEIIFSKNIITICYGNLNDNLKLAL